MTKADARDFKAIIEAQTKFWQACDRLMERNGISDLTDADGWGFGSVLTTSFGAPIRAEHLHKLLCDFIALRDNQPAQEEERT